MMNIKIKKLHKDAVIPQYSTEGAACLDLTCVEIKEFAHGTLKYHTGLAFEIPEGHVGLVFPRSSNSKTDLYLTNSVGVIDSDYRGEVTFVYKERDFNYISDNRYKVGDRVGQIMFIPYPKINFIEADELSETKRGTGGYGSTGR